MAATDIAAFGTKSLYDLANKKWVMDKYDFTRESSLRRISGGHSVVQQSAPRGW